MTKLQKTFWIVTLVIGGASIWLPESSSYKMGLTILFLTMLLVGVIRRVWHENEDQ